MDWLVSNWQGIAVATVGILLANSIMGPFKHYIWSKFVSDSEKSVPELNEKDTPSFLGNISGTELTGKARQYKSPLGGRAVVSDISVRFTLAERIITTGDLVYSSPTHGQIDLEVIKGEFDGHILSCEFKLKNGEMAKTGDLMLERVGNKMIGGYLAIGIQSKTVVVGYITLDIPKHVYSGVG